MARCIRLILPASAAALLLSVVTLAQALGQQPPPTAASPSFEVASVKRNDSGTARSLGGPTRGHFIQSGTLRQLIQAAYRRGGFEIRQVSGGPCRVGADRTTCTAESARANDAMHDAD